jgi:hypothetical protein
MATMNQTSSVRENPRSVSWMLMPDTEKGAVDRLGDEGLPGLGLEARPERVAGLLGSERRAGLDGVVPDMDHGLFSCPPHLQKASPVRVERGVVPAWPRWLVEALLEVDRNQGRARLELHGGPILL